MRRMLFYPGRYQWPRITVALVASLALGIIALTGCSSPTGSAPPTISATASTGNATAATSAAGPGGSSSSRSASASASAGTGQKIPGLIGAVFPSHPQGVTCGNGDTVSVTAGSSGTDFTVTELDTECVSFSGINLSGSPSLILPAPDGAQQTVGTDPAQWVVDPVPGVAPFGVAGQYQFALVSSPSADATPTSTAPATPSSPQPVASGQFTVAEPTGPVAATSPGSGVALAGYPPGSVVIAALYGPGNFGDATFPLYQQLPSITIDSGGGASGQVTIPAGIPAGHYALWFDPPPASCSATQG